MINWRRAYMRLLAWFAHEKLRTSLDIVDMSPMDGNQLGESMIRVHLPMHNDETYHFLEVAEFAEKVMDSLEAPKKSLSISKTGGIIMIFDMEDCKCL